MDLIVDALISACVAALLTWYLTRRLGAGAAPASTTAEIERLRTVVEELTAALENKAEATEQRLTKLMSEAQAVQSVLDRTLTTVGAQVVRPEPTASGPKREIPSATEAETPPQQALPSVAPAVAPEPIAPRERIELTAPAEDLLAGVTVKSEPSTAKSDLLNASVNGRVEAVEPSAVPDAKSTEANEQIVEPPKTAPPVNTAAPEPAKHEAGETAEREAKVMSLVARGITNSVEIARQTGLTRGEVELILTLHNLHIAPSTGTWVEPAPQAAAAAIAAAASTGTSGKQPPKSPDDVVVDPNDRYAAIYELIAAGVTDSVEIARRTGLGRGEVELHMGLHARKVL